MVNRTYMKKYIMEKHGWSKTTWGTIDPQIVNVLWQNTERIRTGWCGLSSCTIFTPY
jgi:hypothetical protein